MEGVPDACLRLQGASVLAVFIACTPALLAFDSLRIPDSEIQPAWLLLGNLPMLPHPHSSPTKLLFASRTLMGGAHAPVQHHPTQP